MAGILGAAYRALDPVLPFDRYLDPRLGGEPVVQAGLPKQQPFSTPPINPQYATQPVMGFPSIPMGGQQAQAPQAAQRPQQGRPSLLQTIWGVAAGYDPQTVREMWTDRQAARQAAAREREAATALRDRQLAFAETLDPRQRAIFLANPGKWAEEAAVSYRPQIAAPGSSAYVNGQFVQAPLTPIEVTAGSAVFDPNKREELYRAPIKPEIVKTSPGETATLVDPGGAASSGIPRGIRNNNPGNIEDGAFAKSLPGYKGSDGRFAIFESPEAGRGAQVALLGSYGQRGFDTVGEIINRWAPPSDNNPTSAYVDYVARRLNVRPDQQLNLSDPQVAGAIADAITAFENGQTGGSGATSRVVAQGGQKPQWRTDGEFQYSPDGKVELLPERKLPAGVQKAEDEDLEAIDTAQGIVDRLRGYQGQIQRGELNFGPVSNFIAGVRLATGTADTNALNYGSFKSDLEKLRNDSLRLNSGVQTEGDAQRAWNELFANLNDEKFVAKRLGEIIALNQRAIGLKEQRIETRRVRNGFGAPASAAAPGGAPKPRPVQRSQPSAGAPRVGEVRQGYRFKGGDPASPSSWQKVQ